MRKLVCVLLSVLLLTALILPVSAVEEVPMFTVTASKSSVAVGQTVTLTVTATENAPECCAFAVYLNITPDVFEVADVSVEDMAGGFSMGACEKGPNPNVGGMNVLSDGSLLAQKPEGVIGTVVLKVKEDAEFGKNAVTGGAQLKLSEDGDSVSGLVEGVTVTITALPGDMNEDRKFSLEDAELLLWANLFSKENGQDLNNDGSMDEKDVVLLLWHILFPKEFPLEAQYS